MKKILLGLIACYMVTIPSVIASEIKSLNGEWYLKYDLNLDGEVIQDYKEKNLQLKSSTPQFIGETLLNKELISGQLDPKGVIINFKLSTNGGDDFYSFLGSSNSKVFYSGTWYSTSGNKGDWTLRKQTDDIFSSCKEILDANLSKGSGQYSIQTSAVSTGVVNVYCDMTTDDGGWTLVGAGVMTVENNSAVVTKTSNHRYTQVLIDGLNATEVKVGDASSNSMYVKDDAFVLEHVANNTRGVYGTFNDELSCSINYGDFKNNQNLKKFPAIKAISCLGDASNAVGQHICASGPNGWVFFDTLGHIGTYNYNGNHPCSTPSRVSNLIWVR